MNQKKDWRKNIKRWKNLFEPNEVVEYKNMGAISPVSGPALK